MPRLHNAVLLPFLHPNLYYPSYVWNPGAYQGNASAEMSAIWEEDDDDEEEAQCNSSKMPNWWLHWEKYLGEIFDRF